LRSNGLLDVSDARIHRMSTIPKMVNARVRTGGFVSIVGPDGNIINGRVLAAILVAVNLKSSILMVINIFLKKFS
ncbi:hypothetical protein, partial [Bacteriovorax sp. DB6_IX]|uniref:hypothetical protein n=1 Tax=Bacteriovorax sp. DB6_IX TaxID=1353530 RepID=UPI0005517CEB